MIQPATCLVKRGTRVYTINVADLGADEVPYVPEAAQEAAGAPTGAEAAQVAAEPGEAPDAGWYGLTVAELAAECQARSIAVPRGARKADLVALLESAEG